MDLKQELQAIANEEAPLFLNCEHAKYFVKGAEYALLSLEKCVPHDLILSAFRDTLREYFQIN